MYRPWPVTQLGTGFLRRGDRAAFAAATAELDLESVDLSLQNAKVDKEYADTRFKNGLIPKKHTKRST
jgi:hypothetical protein